MHSLTTREVIRWILDAPCPTASEAEIVPGCEKVMFYDEHSQPLLDQPIVLTQSMMLRIVTMLERQHDCDGQRVIVARIDSTGEVSLKDTPEVFFNSLVIGALGYMRIDLANDPELGDLNAFPGILGITVRLVTSRTLLSEYLCYRMPAEEG